MSTKVTIPTYGGTPSVSDGTGFAPAIIQYEYWSSSQLSIAKYYGGMTINGRLYKLIDSVEPCPPGKFKPDLVREDWCSLYKKYKRGLREYIIKGMTASQVLKLLKSANDDDKSKKNKLR